MGEEMSYEEFLEKLRATPRDWYLADGAIRYKAPKGYDGPARCPVNRVFGYESSGQIQGPFVAIMRASDWTDPVDPENARIRKDLLEACGLSNARSST